MFTKDLAERYLERYRGNLRVVINRPSMIQGCCRDPFPGWTDSIGAHASVGFASLLGINSNVQLLDGPMDIVPADICSNAVLVTSAFAAQEPLSGFYVFHNTSSTSNPVKPHKYFDNFNELSKFMPAETAVGDPKVILFTNEAYFNFRNFIDYEGPVKVMDAVS